MHKIPPKKKVKLNFGMTQKKKVKFSVADKTECDRLKDNYVCDNDNIISNIIYDNEDS